MENQKPCACGCDSFYTRRQPITSPHAGGLYCMNCDKWQKWLSKSVFENLIGFNNNQPTSTNHLDQLRF
jgi:hypothetical protein